MAVEPSHVSGTCDTPPLEDAIGANLDRAVEAHPGREALIEHHTGRRWTYAPQYVLNQAGVSTLIATPACKTSDYAAMIEQARPKCPDLGRVLLIGGEDWDAMVAEGRSADRTVLAEIAATLTMDDPISTQYTSGTTGLPKGATLSQHNILNNGYFVGEVCRCTERDRICIPAPFHHRFGMTETPPVSAQTRFDDSLDRRVSTVGRVHPHLEIKIIDPAAGVTVPRGEPGELCTRGYSVMLGHWAQPDKTAQVIGVPGPKYGEEPMAWVKLREGAVELTADELREFRTGELAHYKIPRYVHVVDSFPMTVTGKVRKVEMRERAVEILGLSDDAGH